MSSNRWSPFDGEMSIHIVEKVVSVLNCETKIIDPQFIGQ